MMTRYLTVTPSAYVPQCLCCKESLLLIPSLAASLLIRTLSAISANHWYLTSICPSVTPVSPGPVWGQAKGPVQVAGRPTLLQFKKASEFFFPRPQSALRMVAWLSTQSWSSFRMRSAQRLVVLTFAHKKSCSQAAFNVFMISPISISNLLHRFAWKFSPIS